MNLNDDRITVNTELSTYQFLAITMKKLSMGKVLTDFYRGYESQFSFKSPNQYGEKSMFVYNDEANDILTKQILKISYNRSKSLDILEWNNIIQDENIFIADEYVDKFKNYFDASDSSKLWKTQLNLATNISLEEKKDTDEYEITDPYFKQKMTAIGKSIVFYKKNRHSFIAFMLFFNKYMNEKIENTFNLLTLNKFNMLFDSFDEEEVISLPDDQEKIEFVTSVMKYHKILFKKEDSRKSTYSISTSLFKIRFEWESITLLLNGITLCKEHMFGRFKYMDHPGIMLFIKSLKSLGKYDLMFTKIQKHIIKTF